MHKDTLFTHQINKNVTLNPKIEIAKTVLSFALSVFAKNIIPFIKTNDTKNERIIVCFRGLKKSRILIAILDFLSP